MADVKAGKYIVRVPEGELPAPDLVRHIQRQVAEYLGGNLQTLVMPNGWKLEPLPIAPESVLARFAWLRSLAPQELAFVCALAKDPQDVCTLSVFADWLEEQGRPEAERLRGMAQGKLSIKALAEAYYKLTTKERAIFTEALAELEALHGKPGAPEPQGVIEAGPLQEQAQAAGRFIPAAGPEDCPAVSDGERCRYRARYSGLRCDRESGHEGRHHYRAQDPWPPRPVG